MPEELLAPEVRIENIVTAVTDKIHHGAAGCLEWIRDMSDASGEGARLEIEKIIANGED